MNEENYEIDMLDVGAADAILIRYYNSEGNEYIICIDSGNPGDGQKVINHIKHYYNQQYIDLAICTHPDNDHIGGFTYILDNMEIKEFWIHDPSKHIKLEEVKNKIKEHTLSKSLSYITETLEENVSIIEKIDNLGILRKEPFDGTEHSNIPIKVLGPRESFYRELLRRFRNSDLLFEENQYHQKSTSIEDDHVESLSTALDEKNDPSAENNSSAIIAFTPRNRKYLFTADAGPLGIDNVIEDHFELTLNVDWVDIPHHGSKRNLTSKIIKHLSPEVAYVSAQSKKRYLSQAVINAFTKTGTKVYSTHNSGSLWHHVGTQNRRSYSTSTPINQDKLNEPS